MVCSCANGQYLSSIVGELKATGNREGKGIFVSDVETAAAIVRESVSKGEVSELSRELFI